MWYLWPMPWKCFSDFIKKLILDYRILRKRPFFCRQRRRILSGDGNTSRSFSILTQRKFVAQWDRRLEGCYGKAPTFAMLSWRRITGATIFTVMKTGLPSRYKSLLPPPPPPAMLGRTPVRVSTLAFGLIALEKLAYNFVICTHVCTPNKVHGAHYNLQGSRFGGDTSGSGAYTWRAGFAIVTWSLPWRCRCERELA
jgi:hypothetical protein